MTVPTPSATDHGRPRVEGIDGLRAIAMTAVVAQHSGLLPFGWMGVWLFFVISGFVITLGFLQEERAAVQLPAASRYARFMKRRVLRLVPVYLLYVLVCVLASGPRVNGADVLSLLSFTFNWEMIFAPQDPGLVGVGHLWTLSVEQQFYLVFPLLFLGLSARWRWPVVVGLILLSPLLRGLWVQELATLPQGQDTGWLAFGVYAASLCQFESFLWGALLAAFGARWAAKPAVVRAVGGAALALLLAYLVAQVAFNHADGARGMALLKNIYSGILYGHGKEVWGYTIINLAAVALMLQVMAGAPALRFLQGRFISWVGRVSYGGYLFHALVLHAAFALWPKDGLGVAGRLAVFVPAWAATVLLASVSFRYFEQPLAARLKSWAQR